MKHVLVIRYGMGQFLAAPMPEAQVRQTVADWVAGRLPPVLHDPAYTWAVRTDSIHGMHLDTLATGAQPTPVPGPPWHPGPSRS